MNIYTVDSHCAELYDQVEQSTEDSELLLDLIGPHRGLKIFEPFCGTGRLLIPLARAGHFLTGMDSSQAFLDLCHEKLEMAGFHASLTYGNVLTELWPYGFDVVVLGSNCLYELSSIEEQEKCISQAARALEPGGYLFLDNNHMEGDLAPDWQDPAEKPCFPSGLCSDGVRLESTMQAVWSDPAARLVRFRRKTRVYLPDGTCSEHVFEQQKHPVSTGEIHGWLTRFGFDVEERFGSRDRQPYSDDSRRVILWARKG